jgi:glutamate carboxypeptidase
MSQREKLASARVAKRSLPGPDARGLLSVFAKCEAKILDRTRALVEIESPSHVKAAVDQAQDLFAGWAESAGATVRRHRRAEVGESLEIVFGRQFRREPPILLLGHMDTVWEIGTLARMPWTLTAERVAGPGVLDMKAGLCMGLMALDVLSQTGLLRRKVTLLIHGDEEIGSPFSRALTERLAPQSSAVYVLEPAQGERGAYKTARKAIGRYKLAVEGVASHSGVDFAAGHSAIVELARQIPALAALSDPARGATVNPGVIGGGTASNVVAAQAWVDIDVRLTRKAHVVPLERALRKLRPFDPACRLTLTGGINRPPMERSAGTAALFRQARGLALQLGIALEEAATGGASDGNFTAALGVATLDGMGAVGAGAHASHEHVLRSDLVPRTALLAAMLL